MVDIQRLSPAQLQRFIHAQATVDKQIAAALRIQALREYYDGDHATMLTARQQEYLGPIVAGDAFPFAHNLTRTVIDTLAERLSVIGFDVEGDEAEGAPIAAEMWGWWNENRFDSAEADVHTAALRDGFAYVMVGYDNEAGRPRLTFHKAYDGVSGIVAHHDPNDPGKLLLATRYWWEIQYDESGFPQTERKTVYLPDRILKYKRTSAGWTPVADNEAGDDFAVAWRDAGGAGLGVAVVEFANPGGSEIAQIIGLQNAVNKSWLDLMAAADASGFPLLALEYPNLTAPLGPEGDNNLTGDNELNFGPGRAVEVFGGTVDRLAASDLGPMIDTIWALVAAISGVTRTPQYYLRPQGGSDVPSGESLKQLESGLVGRAKKRQNIFGQSWADVMALASRVHTAYGPGLEAPEAVGITTQWQDPETRNELQQAQVAEAHKRLGVPDEQIFQMIGYTPEQIAGFMDSKQAAQAANIASIAAQLQGAQQARGGTQNVGTNRNQEQGGQDANPQQPLRGGALG
jgi:hypothetical protein